MKSYKLLTGVVVPRPVAWVTTLSAAGGVNLAPFSTFTFVSPKPPMLAFSVGQRGGIYKDTARNILADGGICRAHRRRPLIEAVHNSAVEYPPEVSETEMLGLATVPSLHVKPPRRCGRADRDGMPAAPMPRIRRDAQPPDRRRGGGVSFPRRPAEGRQDRHGGARSAVPPGRAELRDARRDRRACSRSTRAPRRRSRA